MPLARKETPSRFLAGYTGLKPVDRSPLHAAYVAATLATVLALSWVEPARSHADVQPGVVEQGAVAELRVELPRLRPGGPPRRLELRGAGVRQLSSRLLGLSGAESRWLAHIRVSTPPGALSLTLRAAFADGEVVEIDYPLTVVPAPQGKSGGVPWPGVILAVALAAVLAVALLRLARRKAW